MWLLIDVPSKALPLTSFVDRACVTTPPIGFPHVYITHGHFGWYCLITFSSPIQIRVALMCRPCPNQLSSVYHGEVVITDAAFEILLENLYINEPPNPFN